MKIGLMSAAALAIALTGAAQAQSQVSEAWILEQHKGMSARSALGICSEGFTCDHVTVAMNGRSVLLQFTEYAGHYISLTGTVDSENPTLVDLKQVYFDGQQIGSEGQCILSFVDGELERISCSALTFTVYHGEESK